MISNIEKINHFFHLPISYNKDKMELNKNIITDLELVETCDPSGISILHNTFQPKNCFGKKILNNFSTYYTTDTYFLKDSQKLLKTYSAMPTSMVDQDYDKLLGIWDEIKNDTGFKEKYHYIDWIQWEYLNKNEHFLQVMSIYNLAAPVLSLLVPFIILIIPFFVIKLKGLDISISEYKEILQVIASQHAIGKLFTQFNEVKLDEKVYLLVSAAFYIFSIYQNMLTCLRFHQNMIKIHEHLTDIQLYIEHTEKTMYNFLLYSGSLTTYDSFNNDIKKHLFVLSDFKLKLANIHPYELNLTKIGEMGIVLKAFYDIYSHPEYNESFLYSFGFHGYIDNLEGLQMNIQNKHIHFAKFTNKLKKSKMNDFYYPSLVQHNPIKNSYSFKKNMIITGPNASGKTTVLKSALINVILTQQMGCGFYDNTTILCPFKYIHCYLNIPDTSGRDSLFQAEARRCKDILDIIQENKDKKDTHFCTFDELYSGTNPDEAVMSAYAFMTYIMKYKNVNCMLTTHFIDLCVKMDKNEQVENYHMKTEKTGDSSFQYTYQLKKGISCVRGGFKVLEDMNYPKEIIDNTTSTF